ncbi:hypothetical protein [Actinomadura formosensis]|uniref:hypothetical protein n=1 Tax=Actinomadura formosensis TaxID=60706 RepID=UPI003D8D47A9
MPDVDTLKAAPKATVVEPGAQIGVSVAVHKDLHTWLRDLEAAGTLIGFGWEIRGQDAPDDWPGWPIEQDGDRTDG